MVLIALTRLLLTLYGIGALFMLVRMISLMLLGAKRSMTDVGNVLLFPLYLLTVQGRKKLETTLTETTTSTTKEGE